MQKIPGSNPGSGKRKEKKLEILTSKTKVEAYFI